MLLDVRLYGYPIESNQQTSLGSLLIFPAFRLYTIHHTLNSPSGPDGPVLFLNTHVHARVYIQNIWSIWSIWSSVPIVYKQVSRSFINLLARVYVNRFYNLGVHLLTSAHVFSPCFFSCHLRRDNGGIPFYLIKSNQQTSLGSLLIYPRLSPITFRLLASASYNLARNSI